MKSIITIGLLPLCLSAGCNSDSNPATEATELGSRLTTPTAVVVTPTGGAATGADTAVMVTPATAQTTVNADTATTTVDVTEAAPIGTPVTTVNSDSSTTIPATTIAEVDVFDVSDWEAPPGCIGDVDANGTQFCVYPETRLFAATASDGTLWWSFVLPGDNATNEIEAVFVFGDQVGLLADKMPSIDVFGDSSVKVNPYEVSLFEKSGAFISTMPLQQDLNAATFSDDTVGHQIGEKPAQVVVVGSADDPQLLLSWTRMSRPSSTGFVQVKSVISHIDLETGAALVQNEFDGSSGELSRDPFFADDVILAGTSSAVRLNAQSLALSNNWVSMGSVDAPAYTRIADRVFELSWPTQFFGQAEQGEITYYVTTYTGFVRKLVPETMGNRALIGLDWPFSSLQVRRLIDGEPDGSLLHLAPLPFDRTDGGCEPVCDLFKAAAAENLVLNGGDRGENLLTWSWSNASEIDRSVIYRNGDLIGITDKAFFNDVLSNPAQADVYTIIGITTQGSETLPSSVAGATSPELPLTLTPTEELITSEFVEAISSHAIGTSILSRTGKGFSCGSENKQRVSDHSSQIDFEDYFFNCETSDGISSGTRAFAKPIPWAGHYHSWRSDESEYTDFRFRDSVSDELVLIDGDITLGDGGGGVPDHECPLDWRSSFTERNNIDVSAMSVFDTNHDWTITNAQVEVYRAARSVRNLSETGEVLGCVRSVTVGGESNFELTDTLLGIDVSVTSSILFYVESPPEEPSEEHYDITVTRSNGDVIEIKYPAIGANTALVTYPQSGDRVTVEVSTVAAPFEVIAR